MTEVAFHFGAADKLGYTCRLLRKAVGTGASVAVVCDAATQQELDEALWALSPTDFVAHCSAQAAAQVQQASPIVLLTSVAEDAASRQVLVNLCDDLPQGFERYARLIEVVSDDPVDRQQARQRWREYTSRGYAIVRHDLTQKGAGQ